MRWHTRITHYSQLCRWQWLISTSTVCLWSGWELKCQLLFVWRLIAVHRIQKAAEQCDTVTHEMDNSPHSDEVINLQPLHCLTFSNTHLVTLLLQSGLSSALQPPQPRCSFSSSLLSRLYFGLALLSPFFPPTVSSPSHLSGEELGVVPPHESHVSGEQRGRQRAEWNALPAGETGKHRHSGGSAVQPAGWAQGTGTVLLRKGSVD